MHDRRRQLLADGKLRLPEYNAIQFFYQFHEGVEPGISANNIFFDSKSTPTYGSDVLTNGDLNAPYTAGVASGWAIDAGVTATQAVDVQDGGGAQQLTNLNGAGQAFRQTGIAITTGNIYLVTVNLRCTTPAGTLSISLNGMTDTTAYTANTVSLNPADGYTQIRFYTIAASGTTNLQITCNNTAMVCQIGSITLKNVGGGNHMVMKHSLYTASDRGDNYYKFDGVSDYASITDTRQSNMDLGTKWSSVAIMKINSDGRACTKWNATGNQRGWEACVALGTRQLATYFSTNGIDTNTRTTAVNTLPAFPWTDYMCVGCSFDNGTVTFYINGVNSPTTTVTGAGTTVFNNTSDAYIGRDSGGTLFLDGYMGKQALWNGIALTAAQHKQVFGILRTEYGI